MKLKKSNLTFIILVLLIILHSDLFSQNRLDSRVFYEKPELFHSLSQVKSLRNNIFIVNEPTDRRVEYFGETVYKRKKVQHFNDFWKNPVTKEIQKKIKNDFDYLTTYDVTQIKTNHTITINPTIEVFYPDVRGFIWGKSFAKVRLNIEVINEKNEILIDKKYESFYISDGTDAEWEGSLAETIENGANITIGIALRKALDIFYKELNDKL